LRRELGCWGAGDGPTLLVTGAVHGNESAGPKAVRRILDRLQQDEIEIRGRVVGLVGNLQALASGVRFVERDLNRQWLPDSIEALLARDRATDKAEDREQRQLIECFERVWRSANGPLVFVDLHSSSAAGPPFTCLADSLDNRRVAMATGLPVILGLEDAVAGSLVGYWGRRGVVSFAIEGGRHEDPVTVDNHEAGLLLLLEYVGILGRGQLDLSRQRAHVKFVTRDVPSVVEIIGRHPISAEDRFEMLPGYRNFQSIERGRHLATDRGGRIRADRSCRVMLPLYQAQGVEGFFLAREVRPVWLGVAALLRRLRLDAIVHWLPGVRRSKTDHDTILVNPRFAQRFATRLLHLLGFRRAQERGAAWSFTRSLSRPENRGLGPRD